MSKKRVKTNRLNKLYFMVKNNLAMILLIPTLAGGIWQILSLLNLGFEYVRFFSASQLVADGLLMIILIPVVCMLPFLGYHGLKSIRSEALEKKNKYLFIKELSFLFVSMTLLVLLIYTHTTSKGTPSSFLLFSSILVYAAFIENTYILGERIGKRLNIYIRLLQIRSRSIIQKTYTYVLMLLKSTCGLIWMSVLSLSSILLFILFFHIIDFLGSYFISDNLYNVKNVESIIKNKYDIDKYEIKYFNDTYIFVEYTLLSEEEINKLKKEEKELPTEIIILKFDTLFKSEIK